MGKKTSKTIIDSQRLEQLLLEGVRSEWSIAIGSGEWKKFRKNPGEYVALGVCGHPLKREWLRPGEQPYYCEKCDKTYLLAQKEW